MQPDPRGQGGSHARGRPRPQSEQNWQQGLTERVQRLAQLCVPRSVAAITEQSAPGRVVNPAYWTCNRVLTAWAARRDCHNLDLRPLPYMCSSLPTSTLLALALERLENVPEAQTCLRSLLSGSHAGPAPAVSEVVHWQHASYQVSTEGITALQLYGPGGSVLFSDARSGQPPSPEPASGPNSKAPARDMAGASRPSGLGGAERGAQDTSAHCTDLCMLQPGSSQGQSTTTSQSSSFWGLQQETGEDRRRIAPPPPGSAQGMEQPAQTGGVDMSFFGAPAPANIQPPGSGTIPAAEDAQAGGTHVSLRITCQDIARSTRFEEALAWIGHYTHHRLTDDLLRLPYDVTLPTHLHDYASDVLRHLPPVRAAELRRGLHELRRGGRPSPGSPMRHEPYRTVFCPVRWLPVPAFDTDRSRSPRTQGVRRQLLPSFAAAATPTRFHETETVQQRLEDIVERLTPAQQHAWRSLLQTDRRQSPREGAASADQRQEVDLEDEPSPGREPPTPTSSPGSSYYNDQALSAAGPLTPGARSHSPVRDLREDSFSRSSSFGS